MLQSSKQQHFIPCGSCRSLHHRQQWLPARPQQHPLPLRRCRGRRAVVQVAAARDPYELLGVSRTANVDEIKKAFRKRALKLHPDVNKAPDAKERFMEAKQAYQQLLDERERGGSSSSSRGGGSSAGYGAGRGAGSGAGSGASSWGGYRGATGGSSSGGGYGQSSQRRMSWEPEDNYSFSDLLRDLDKELSDYSRRKAAARASSGSSSSGGGSGAPKSLWEELYDIGEEFVEFLEQGLGVSDDEASAYGDLKRKYGDLSGSGARAAAGSNTDNSGSSSSTGARPNASAGAGAGSRSSGYSSTSGSGSGRYGGASSSSTAGPAMERKSTAEYVEEELEALKRKLGKK